MSLRALILALILATSTACTSISSSQNQVEEQEKTQGVAEVPEFLLDSSKYDSIEYAEDDRYSCVGALVTETADIIGSAVLIHPKVILTAQHCFAESILQPQYFLTQSGDLIKIEKIFFKEGYTSNKFYNDIAICILEKECVEPPSELLQNSNDLVMNEPVTMVGWSLGYKKISQPGVMRYYGSLIEDGGSIMRMLALNGSAYFGDSGGAVFEDSGKLAGIIDFIRIDPDSPRLIDNGAARVDYHYEWINKILSKEVCDWPWFKNP